MRLQSRLLGWLFRGLGLALLGLHLQLVLAQEDTGADKPATSTGEEQRFIELLEFIGEFTTEEGHWIDPEQLEDETETKTETKTLLNTPEP